VPRYALVWLGLPGHTEVEDVTALYRGMLEMTQQFGVALAGGDITGSPQVAITVTVLGSARGGDNHILTRSGAEHGDRVAVTGYLGAAASGLKVLSEKLELDPEATGYLKRAFLHPCPRVSEGQLLVEQGVKTAIDVSDGLISDLGHICRLSRVGARIEVERVPVEPRVRANFGERALELALSGGEDYELLFTGSARTVDRVKALLSCPVTVIGEILADKPGEVTLVDGQGGLFPLPRAGWEHFTAE